jgi:hypothetical protein
MDPVNGYVNIFSNNGFVTYVNLLTMENTPFELGLTTSYIQESLNLVGDLDINEEFSSDVFPAGYPAKPREHANAA